MLTAADVCRTFAKISSGVACPSVCTASSTSCRCGVSRWPRDLSMRCQSPTPEVYDLVAWRRPRSTADLATAQLDLNRARLRLAFRENAYHYGDVRPDPGFRARR